MAPLFILKPVHLHRWRYVENISLELAACADTAAAAAAAGAAVAAVATAAVAVQTYVAAAAPSPTLRTLHLGLLYGTPYWVGVNMNSCSSRRNNAGAVTYCHSW